MKTCIKNSLLLLVVTAALGSVLAGQAAAQTLTTLYSFTATPASAPYINSDGAGPEAGLLSSGNTLYGTTLRGGFSGNGTVFAVNADGAGFTNLHSFTAVIPYYTNNFGAVFSSNSDGAISAAGLILSGNTLYGTTINGGSSGSGTVFAVNTDGTGFTNLHSLSVPVGYGSYPNYTNSDGFGPVADLIFLGNTLYGTVLNGGDSGSGTIFSLSLPVTSPQLTLTTSGSNVLLTWPTNFTGFTLQSTKNLASPGWTTNLPAPVVVNGQYTATNPISGTQQFFRLSQ